MQTPPFDFMTWTITWPLIVCVQAQERMGKILHNHLLNVFLRAINYVTCGLYIHHAIAIYKKLERRIITIHYAIIYSTTGCCGSSNTIWTQCTTFKLNLIYLEKLLLNYHTRLIWLHEYCLTYTWIHYKS